MATKKVKKSKKTVTKKRDSKVAQPIEINTVWREPYVLTRTVLKNVTGTTQFVAKKSQVLNAIKANYPESAVVEVSCKSPDNIRRYIPYDGFVFGGRLRIGCKVFSRANTKIIREWAGVAA